MDVLDIIRSGSTSCTRTMDETCKGDEVIYHVRRNERALASTCVGDARQVQAYSIQQFLLGNSRHVLFPPIVI